MAKRRRKSISRGQADVGPPAVEAVVGAVAAKKVAAKKVAAQKVAAEIDRPVTDLRAAVVAETVRRATVLPVSVLPVSVLRVVVEVSGRLAVRVAEDRLAMLLVARQLQNSIRRLVI